ncbi:MAG: RNA pyrophosphohydrolase [Leptospiraceae bacterium]|nr:RNA pyrophosphohydrolase [Leptospiraceae bacterium]
MKPYRKNVGVVVFNSKGLVLLGNRISNRSSWQFPQGGMDDNEEPIVAAKRELYEEVGIDNAEFVYEIPEWLNYDFPENMDLPHLKEYRGQTQKWFLAYWDYPTSKCKLDVHEREFETVQFFPLKNAGNTVIEFKKEIYKKLIQVLPPEIEKFLKTRNESK